MIKLSPASQSRNSQGKILSRFIFFQLEETGEPKRIWLYNCSLHTLYEKTLEWKTLHFPLRR